MKALRLIKKHYNTAYTLAHMLGHPLCDAFCLFICAVTVLPLLLLAANAVLVVVASAPTTKVAAIKTATIVRVLFFVLFI
jgi:hypothetical protein